MTAAWWQVLGAVLHEPLPVAGIARAMGITRQSVQRIADLLVERGLAAYHPNPAHRRAKLLAPTEEGRAAIARITPGHAEFADLLRERLGGTDDFHRVMTALEDLSDALETLPRPSARLSGPRYPRDGRAACRGTRNGTADVVPSVRACAYSPAGGFRGKGGASCNSRDVLGSRDGRGGPGGSPRCGSVIRSASGTTA